MSANVSDLSSRKPLGKAVVFGSYPIVMLACIGIFEVLVLSGLSLTLASYLAVVTGALLITCHEIFLPYRNEWKPRFADIGNDALFMAVVQIAVPLLLSISLVLWIAGLLRSSGTTIELVWPHELPVAAQAALMLLIADFFRYWMHRAFHKFTFMWRFHAVHHSPHILYWLNVGRFHPIEKAVQYSVDALPFALLGVSNDVLSAYFVVFAINGFFQHSNCLVRLGPLNYVVSGPELHRWHHSEFVEESDRNFGNNLIVWDLLFGTRFLPEDREVGALGLPNRRYPTGFLVQMKTPFVRGLEGN